MTARTACCPEKRRMRCRNCTACAIVGQARTVPECRPLAIAGWAFSFQSGGGRSNHMDSRTSRRYLPAWQALLLSRLAHMTLLLLPAASLGAQTTPSNIGPTPPPRVNEDLTVTYFLNAPNAKEVLLADTAVSPGPPGKPLTQGPDGMWSV